MRILIQRVSSASLCINGEPSASIGIGMVILVGIGHNDTLKHVKFLAEKAVHLRVFDDEDGKMNRSILDVGGEALIVSQFTLYADTRKGRRPSYIGAAEPTKASLFVDEFAKRVANLGVPVQSGEFGAHMNVSIQNDGPVTIWIEK